MDGSLQLIVAFLFFAALIYGASRYEQKAREIVQDELERKGCQEIEITRTLKIGTREITYDVKYRNQQGKLTVNSCIVSGFFSPREVYWKNPI